jgi:glycosyltransferase involved in cell wall biosynthesis
VMSQFARRGFLSNGISDSRLLVVPAGAEIADFAPKDDELSARLQRISAYAKLRVMLVGTLSAQKGVLDLVKIVQALGARMQFEFVGTIAPEAQSLLHSMPMLKCHARVEQHALHDFYASADIFLHLTIQDGFAVVIAQALMSGLPVLCTSHCAASDVITDGEHGYVFEIRKPEAIIDTLLRLDADRDALATLVRRVSRVRGNYSWQRAAQVFVEQHQLAMSQHIPQAHERVSSLD